MDFSTDFETNVPAIATLFETTFTTSEHGALLGGIFFTRLTYGGDPRKVFAYCRLTALDRLRKPSLISRMLRSI